MPLLNDADALYLGSSEVDAIYLGGEKVWPSVPWAPTDIPGLMTWLDPAQDMIGDGQTVTSYTEHSQAARTYLAAGVPPIFRGGGRPYIDFPSNCQGLYCTGINLGMAGLTYVMVNSYPGTMSYPMLLVHHTTADGHEMRMAGMTMEIVLSYTSAGMYFQHTTVEVVDQVYLRILREDIAGNKTDTWVGNVKVTGGRGVMPNVPTSQYVGLRQGGYYFSGKVYEALVYAGPVSDVDLTLLHNYLIEKHGLPGGYW